MNLTEIALTSIQRRKSRVLFLLLGLIISTATAVTLVGLGRGVTADVAHRLDEYGANIIVVPESDGLTLSYGGVTVPGAVQRLLSVADLDRLRTIRNAGNISTIAPKLSGRTTLNGTPVLLVGVRFAEEFRLKKWWRLSEGIRPTDDRSLLLGAQAADALSLKVGDQVMLGGETLGVSGVLEETGSEDDGLVFVDLDRAGRHLGTPGKAGFVEIAALCAGCPIEDMVAQVAGVLPGTRVRAMKETLELKMEAVGRFFRFSYGVSGIIAVVAGMIVFTTMMASVSERRKEIGIYRAVGFRRRHVMRVVYLEAGLLGLIGGLIGAGLGAVLPARAAPFLALTQGLEFPLDPAVGLVAVVVSGVLALLAAVYPAYRAAGLEPAEALRDL